MIRHKNFTNHESSTLNKSPIMTNQQRKSQTNQKWIQKFYKKIMLKLDIQKSHHAKIQHNWQSNGMENKISNMNKKWCLDNHIISYKPEMQK